MSRETCNGRETLLDELLAPTERPHESWTDRVELPVESAVVALRSGRRFEIESGDECDRLKVRSSRGEIVLDVRVTDAGPVLRFSGAEVELEATRRLVLDAAEVAVRASQQMSVEVEGDLEERVRGNHHSRINGEERLEAASVAVQSNESSVSLRAMDKVALDGEHIGLNDEPALEPFAWSALGKPRRG